MPKFLLGLQGALVKEILITKPELTVGRNPDNDIVIDNPAVSGHHCKITLIGDTYFVEDLSSSNGVFVNTKKTTKAGLKNNDVIGIVKHTLKFVEDGAEPEAPPPQPAGRMPEATIMMTPEKRQEIAGVAAAAAQKAAIAHVVKGAVGETEYELKAQSTYLGKSEHAQIKIKGGGWFRPAPETACMIARRFEGYFIIPVKENYARVNGKVLKQREMLQDGDLIEVGGTTIQFELPN
jgi:pSer/pThr/pTyr-binding forkhead associated (FHA) protein